MSRYSIFLKPSAIKDLRPIPADVQRLIKGRLMRLADDPFPPDCKKLSDNDSMFRVWQGKYRIIYTVDIQNHSITILAIEHRREAYRSLN